MTQRVTLVTTPFTSNNDLNDWQLFGTDSKIWSDPDCPVYTECVRLRDGDEIYRYISTVGYHSIQVEYTMQSDDRKDNEEPCEFYTIFGQESDNIAQWTSRSSDYSQDQPSAKTIVLPSTADNQQIVGIHFLVPGTANGMLCYYNDVSVTGILITSSPTTTTPTTAHPATPSLTTIPTTSNPTATDPTTAIPTTTIPTTTKPTLFPTKFPTTIPTQHPSLFPSRTPTIFASIHTTLIPTKNPSNLPTIYPTSNPTKTGEGGVIDTTMNTNNNYEMDQQQMLTGANTDQTMIIIILSSVLGLLILGIIGYIVYRKLVNKTLSNQTVSNMTVSNVNGHGEENELNVIKKIENEKEFNEGNNILNIETNDNESEEELYKTHVQEYVTPKNANNESDDGEELYDNKSDVNITEGNNDDIDHDPNQQQTKGYVKEDQSESSGDVAHPQTTKGYQE